MYQRSIPSVVMLKNKYGDISLLIDSVMITVYPYTENIPRTEYSTRDYHAYGEMLGKIHAAGLEVAHQNLFIKEFTSQI